MLFLEADTIIGKPSAGVEIDDTPEVDEIPAFRTIVEDAEAKQ